MPMTDLTCRIASLHVYPIKSCAGATVDDNLLIETGLEFDRAWMLVDDQGVFVTQRELPRMALVRPTMKYSEMVLRAPGMLPLAIAFDRAESPARVRVWDDEVPAYDMGDLAAQWFSDFLGPRLRLVRFDPEARRLADHRWTNGADAEIAFADGYPLLIASTASLDELNRRLVAAGHAAVTMARLRPNIVLDGLEPHGEDQLDTLRIETPEGPVVLRMAKPCTRCTIPDVDPLTGERPAGGAMPVQDTLSAYRRHPAVDGAVAFGMNACIVEGIDRELRRGQDVTASIRF